MTNKKYYEKYETDTENNEGNVTIESSDGETPDIPVTSNVNVEEDLELKEGEEETDEENIMKKPSGVLMS